MLPRVRLMILTCWALTFASFFQASFADLIVTPMATADDRKLLDAYEAAGGALNAVDLVCFCGAVMLAITFFERAGRTPTTADRASSADVLQEVGIQRAAAGAPVFAKQPLSQWVEQYHDCWRNPHKEINFYKELGAQTGMTAEDARKITPKLHELDWSKGTFEKAAAGLARVRKLYEAASVFFQAAVVHMRFTEIFPHIASGLEDARDSCDLVRGGIDRWRQFSIKRRTLEWQRLYEQSPQTFYDTLVRSSPSKFETSIWLRELDKLHKLLHTPMNEACDSDSKLDPHEPSFLLDAHGQPDIISAVKLGPHEEASEKPWDDDDDLKLDEQRGFSLSMGETCQAKWLKKRKLPCDLVAAGEFEEALGLLKRRLGVLNAEPFQELFKEAYWAACTSLPGLPQSASIQFPLLAEGSMKSRDISPVVMFSVHVILDKVKTASRLTTAGKFSEALAGFRRAIQAIPLSVAHDQAEEQSLTEMITICLEYLNFCRLEITRRSTDPANVARKVELASYFTCCKVSQPHRLLALQLAMCTAFKAQNYVSSASFAKRLIQGFNTEKDKDVIAKAKQVEKKCEQIASESHAINFDPKGNPEDFRLCSGSFTPIAPTDPTVQCPYCGAVYHASYKGKLCDVCQISEIGANTLGIQLRPF